MNNLGQQIANLSSEQLQALRDKLAKKRKKGRSRTAEIQRQARTEAVFPLSFAQRRLWFHQQMVPDSVDYNLFTVYDVAQNLDVRYLRRALSLLVEHHEIFRTTFTSRDGLPVQVIHPQITLDLPMVDLARLTDEERREEACLRVLEAGLASPFHLETGPVLRMVLVLLGQGEAMVALFYPHIISDAWSQKLLYLELDRLYSALVRGAALPAAPKIQYVDYACWQQERLEGGELARQLKFWKEQLGHRPAVLRLPTDRARTAHLTTRGGRVSWRCPHDLRDGLRRLGRSAGASSMMVLLALFQLLLHRTSGQDPILVGSPVANRDRPELQGMLGFFVNMLALAGKVSGTPPPTFSGLLARVKKVCLGAFSHQDLPFEKLVEELQPDRDLTRNPLFEVVFNYIPMKATGDDLSPQEATEGGGSLLETLRIVSQFDLSLVLQEKPWGILVELDYKVDLFDRTTAQRLLGHFRTLLQGALATPSRPIDRLRLLNPAEHHQMTREWNAAPQAAAEVPLHRLFERQAAQIPDAIAVTSPQGPHLTYGELERRANRLAHRLVERGVGPETVVALVAVRSPELILGALAILKAGGAYLPLAPDHPRQRLCDVLRDSKAHLVLAQGAAGADLPGTVLDLQVESAAGPTQPPQVPCRLENLAYVLFTSGSTGKAKGVGATHRGVLRLVRETNFFRADRDDIFLHFAPLAFDASTFEIWAALSRGARLALVPDGAPSPRELGACIRQQRVTMLWLTAELFHLMVDQSLDALATVRHLIAGGDVLSVERVRELLAQLPDVCLSNGYGPTENTTFTACCALTAETSLAHGVPLGRPIHHSDVLLLDGHTRPVPIGVVGELATGGAGLARGYLAAPARTAEVFIPHPLAQQPGQRLYRTGDLCRYLPGGEILFLGRRDQQVKIRGFRIEPGEIEAALRSHPEVHEAVVLVRQEASKSLVAWIRTAAPLKATTLRHHLRRSLPEFMLPTAFFFVDTWPMNANGKVDRAALHQRMAGAAPRREISPTTAPRSPIEAAVVALFEESLEGTQVGIEDDFFLLGGHSLLATQILSAIRQTWQAEISLRFFFEHPTPAELALAIQQRRTGSLPEVPLVATDRRQPLELSFAQQRLWFLDRLEPGSSQYNMAEVIEFAGRVDAALLGRSLSTLVERHETLRTRFVEHRGAANQQIDPARPQPLPVIDLSRLPSSRAAAAARHWAARRAQEPFDLLRGPLLRTDLLRGDADVLVFTLHHIICDGWSLRVFGRELATLYQALARGEGNPLPRLPIQYADYAVWQRRWFKGEVLANQLNSWRQRLHSPLPVLELPTDRPRPAEQSFVGATLTYRLPADLATDLVRFSHQHHGTLFMTLLAGFFTLLHRTTGQRDLIAGSPIANRNRAATESLIGFFVNTLVLRADLSSAPGFAALLSQVRDVTLEAYDHQDLPFEMLVDDLAIERDLSRNPLYQALFDFHTDLETADDGWDLDRGAAICDLSLSAFESPSSLLLGAEYSTALFDATTLRRWLRHYENLLRAALKGPALPVEALPFSSAAERHQVLVEWNPSPLAPVAQLPVHRQIAQRAEQAADAIAVVCGLEHLSYGELQGRALHLSRRLRTLGVGPEVLVALALPRSNELLTAILAVLEAGGAWIPLDLEDPEERRTTMGGPAQVLVTQEQELTITPLAGHPTRSPSRSSPAHGAPAEDQNLAYCIYTSGSTGQPKGVLIEHAALRHYVETTRRQLALRPGDRVLQFAAPGFDVTIEEIFPTLVAGATLVLLSAPQLLAPRELTALIRRERLTGFELPTHFWSEWSQALAAEGQVVGGALRYVLIGTERVAAEPLDLWRQQRIPLLHVYGLTEVTVTSLGHWFNAFDTPVPPSHHLPIGRPQGHNAASLLDRHLRLVPLAAVGELFLGGACLGRGYLGQPARTAQRFVPDPRGRQVGGRLYRSGDLARQLPGGEMLFLGRRDQQVKIRGYRIELGEVETAIADHPSVATACAVVRHDLPGGAGIVVYAVGQGAKTLHPAALRDHLKETLPQYMVPAATFVLKTLPTTANGKIDRRRLSRRPLPTEEEPTAQRVAPRGELEERIGAIWSEVLERRQVGAEDNFFDLGGNSLLLVRVHSRLRQSFDREFPLVDLFRHPTVRSLAHFFGASQAQPSAIEALPERTAQPPDGDERAIAIIGMAGRFPGAPDLDTFWHNIRQGISSIQFFSDEELLAAGVPREEFEDPHYVRAHGTLEDITAFDAGFFDMSPREAEILDPQHRLFLESAWTALEHSGHDPGQSPGRIGVYAGCAGNGYHLHHLLPNLGLLESLDETRLDIASSGPFLATRVSYKLDLRGPSLSLQTACSTSLVAVVQACISLRQGQCDFALAGGVALRVPQQEGYLHQPGSIMSPDGHCRAFDAQAAGTVGGDGVGVVVLRRLADALAAGDTIHAVIRGFAVNNDGAAKVGFTAPGIDGQAEVIEDALRVAGASPRSLGYVEAHGTGTALGDPTEVAALTQVFRRHTADRGFCALGSVKANIGHTDDAAGIAGLLKTVQALRHRELPPTPWFRTPNPQLDLENSPFYVLQRVKPWHQPLRRAGVSSFGIGGTNAHVLLEEAPASPPASTVAAPYLWLLSARSAAALERKTEDLVAHLEKHPELAPRDVAFTLQAGRQAMPHRRVLVCTDLAQGTAALRSRDPHRLFSGHPPSSRCELAFLFPGQGAQQIDMGREMYDGDLAFRHQVDHCCTLLKPVLGIDLRTVLFPAAADHAAAAGQLQRTEFTQPALFVVEYALARWLLDRGIEPIAMLGHSVGELVAACLAGVFELPDALTLVARRGQLMQSLPAGAMTAVSLAPEVLEPLLGPGLSIAAINAPARTVVSGEIQDIEALEVVLDQQRTIYQRLPTSHAFHSAMVEPLLEAFRAVVEAIPRHPPRRRLISNLTGDHLTTTEARDPGYWVEHLRRPVNFAKGLQGLLRGGNICLLEVGPGKALTGFARRQPGDKPALAVASLATRRGQSADPVHLLKTVGRLWLAGFPLEGQRLFDGPPCRRLPLPTYPFERQRYWIDPPQIDPAEAAAAASTSGEQKNPDLAQWFYLPAWKRTLIPPSLAAEGPPSTWLVFLDSCGLGHELHQHLIRRGDRVVRVLPGAHFTTAEDDLYTLNATASADYRKLFQTLNGLDQVPRRILHLWSLDPEEESTEFELHSANRRFETAQQHGLYSLLALVQALSILRGADDPEIFVVSNRLHEVTGHEPVQPEKATLLSLCRVLPQEHPQLRWRSIDLELPQTSSQRGRLVERLLRDVDSECSESVIAYRGHRRFAEAFELQPLPPPPSSRLRQGGVYLLTGGLGQLGLALSHLLGKKYQARLVLVGRSVLPPRSEWHACLENPDQDDPTVWKINQLLALEQAGVEPLLLTADVAQRDAMENVLRRAEEHFGPVDGVFHLAGLTNSSAYLPIQETDPENAEQHFAAKVHGTLVLHALLREREMDFCLVFSSLAAVLGGLGYVSYTAANLFLASWAGRAQRHHSTPWICVDWDGWRLGEDDEVQNGDVPPEGGHLLHLAMTAEEGFDAIERILAQEGLERVVVSTADLEGRIGKWLLLESLQESNSQEAPAAHRHPRPEELSTAFVAPQTALEEDLANIWQELLGIEEVGTQDNFFELGGDSLLAIHLSVRLRQRLAVELTGASLLEAQTIEEQASLITPQLGRRVEAGAPATTAPTPGEVLVLSPQPRDRAHYPPSFAQERLWVAQKADPESADYHLFSALPLRGRLDTGSLQHALAALVQRHEVLHVAFRLENDRPRQVVQHQSSLPVLWANLSALPVSRRQEILLLACDTFVAPPFDLEHGPLLRLLLISLQPEHHLVFFCYHHIITDHWSIDIFQREFETLYHALCAGQPSPLAPQPLQYIDYAVAQRAWFRSAIAQKHLDYWRERLDAGSRQLRLPLDHPRPPLAQHSGGRVSWTLPAPLTENLARLCRATGVSTAMACLAAWKVLLERTTGQGRLRVGSPIANRDRPEVQNILGFFVNLLVYVTDLTDDPPVRELLARVKKVCLGAYAHQDMPFEQLVEVLGEERDPSRHPLFQVAFNFLPSLAAEATQESNVVGPEVGGEEDLELPRIVSLFDLTLILHELPQGRAEKRRLAFDLEYRLDLFDRTTIQRMAHHLQRLLAAMVARPDDHLAELPMLGRGEQHQLLQAWNDTVTNLPHQPLHQLFAQQATSTPQAVAAIHGAQHLSYAGLAAAAHCLAARLRHLLEGQQAAQPGTPRIGLFTERSLEMVVGLVAILEAGGTYVPLDPSYPVERLRWMIEDADLAALLTSTRLAPEHHQGLPQRLPPTLLLESSLKVAPDTPTNAQHCAATAPEDLAYVMYTSGSTGRPKGIGISHRGVVRLVRETNYARFGPEEIFLQLAPISFDASTFEIWGALLHVGCLVIAPAQPPTLEELGRLLARQRVTTLWLTAGLFHLMVDERPRDLAPVKQLLAGGDALSGAHLERLLRALPGLRVINGYGPTESTTFACCHAMAEPPATASDVVIGRPIANTRTFVLNHRLRPLPLGAAGELVLAGVGLARGYLAQPGRTAERFVPDPFAAQPGGRLYRTGDWARLRQNGTIEFLGRLDDQVKIRGFRIELGEIEAVLDQHPGIRQAVVLALQDASGAKSLCACVVCPSVALDGLRPWLGERLPEYMVPSTFKAVEGLPRTPHGKIDRAALAQQISAEQRTKGQRQKGAHHAAARNRTEERLAEIWRDVLDLDTTSFDTIGMEDNFFDLGGNSLLALALLSRISNHFGVALPLRVLFGHPTIALLASALEKEPESMPPLVELQGGNPVRPPLFLLHPVGGTLLCYADLVASLGPEQPCFGVESSPDEGAAPKSLEATASTYLQAIVEQQPEGPYRLAGWSMGGVIAFEIARQLHTLGQPVELLALIDSHLAEKSTQVETFSEPELIFLFLEDLTQQPGVGQHAAPRRALQSFSKAIALADEQATASQMLALAQKHGLLGKNLQAEQLLQPFLVFKRNFLMLHTYEGKPYSGQVTLFRPPQHTAGDAAWQALAELRIHEVSGDHFSLLRQPAVLSIAQEIRQGSN